MSSYIFAVSAKKGEVSLLGGARFGALGSLTCMEVSARLARFPIVVALGREVRLVDGFRARLLGLSHLDRERAGGGLLIPRCSSVHTFGMRFALDIYFLDAEGAVLLLRRGVPPRRLAFCRGASAVLEIPSGEGGEILSPDP